jgi:hypothetical protein
MIKRRVAIQLLALMLALPTMAVADNLPTLPVPHFVNAPDRIPEGPSRTVKFSFSATAQSVSVYELNEHVQQWYCLPGKDSAPTDISIHSSPWPGQQASCKLEENWGGLSNGSPTPISSGSIMFPIRGESRLDPGTLYVRVRLYWSDHAGAHAKDGGWSAWHRTLVEDTHRAKFAGTKGVRVNPSPVGSPNIKIDMKGVKPPVITAPSEGQVFHGGPLINLSGSVGPHNPYSDWSCCFFQWKRAVVVTQENNAYAQAHTPGHSAFPTAPMPWQGFAANQASAVKESGPSFHGYWFYKDFRPHDHTFGYRYWFRVREDSYGQYGPWSAWRSFTVQEPIEAATPYHGGMQVKPGAHVGSPSTGQQQNNHKLAPMMPMHLR